MANNSYPKEKKKKTPTELNLATQKIWDSIAKNYDMINGAQLSNSFIILMALNDSKNPLNTTQISEVIALGSRGQIYKISATLKDSLEHRLKREGYVKGVDLPNKSLYSITPKGKKLLDGWIAFLSAYS
jgi:predicted transcriptional regulator